MATISTPAGIIKTSVTPTTIGIVSNAHFHWNPDGAGAGGVAEGVAAVTERGLPHPVQNESPAASCCPHAHDAINTSPFLATC
jgi:hypothetical protein